MNGLPKPGGARPDRDGRTATDHVLPEWPPISRAAPTAGSSWSGVSITAWSRCLARRPSFRGRIRCRGSTVSRSNASWAAGRWAWCTWPAAIRPDGRSLSNFCRAVGGPAQRERRQWLREAEAASLVRHPNVVTLYEVVEADDWFLLVLEYIPGGTLADRLSAPLAPRRRRPADGDDRPGGAPHPPVRPAPPRPQAVQHPARRGSRRRMGRDDAQGFRFRHRPGDRARRDRHGRRQARAEPRRTWLRSRSPSRART